MSSVVALCAGGTTREGGTSVLVPWGRNWQFLSWHLLYLTAWVRSGEELGCSLQQKICKVWAGVLVMPQVRAVAVLVWVQHRGVWVRGRSLCLLQLLGSQKGPGFLAGLKCCFRLTSGQIFDLLLCPFLKRQPFFLQCLFSSTRIPLSLL